MKFESFEIAEDEKDYGYMYGKRSEDGKYEILVGVVIFGYRVYVRIANDRTLFLKDLCGGAQAKSVSLLYSLVETQLSKESPIEELLEEFPTQYVKPFTSDIDFMFEFGLLMGGEDLIPNDITQEGLQEGRTRLLEKYK